MFGDCGCCLLFVVCWLLCSVCCVRGGGLLVVCSLLFDGCCLSCVVSFRCLAIVVMCCLCLDVVVVVFWLRVVRCVLCVVCRVMVYCFLFVGWRV